MFTEFAQAIVGPADMRDFDPARQRYATQGWSQQRTYAFHTSARDLARLGQLYLDQGEHDGRSVIPAGWVTASTRPRTQTGRAPPMATCGGPNTREPAVHRYRSPPGSFAAYGMGSQFLLVMPAIDRVIALLANPQRHGGTDRAARRPALARLIHHATGGAAPLTPHASPAST